MEREIMVKLVGENGEIGIGATPDEVVEIAASLLFVLSEQTDCDDLEVMSSLIDAYSEMKANKTVDDFMSELFCDWEDSDFGEEEYNDSCDHCGGCDNDYDEELIEQMKLFTEFARDLMERFKNRNRDI